MVAMFEALLEILHGIRWHHSDALGHTKTGIGFHYPLCCILYFSIRSQLTYFMPFNMRVLLCQNWSNYTANHFSGKWIRCPLHKGNMLEAEP
jgi:hypothetical protein